MIFCCTHTSVPCPVTIREASSDTRWEWGQRPTTRHDKERKSGDLPLVLSLGDQGTFLKRSRKDIRSQRVGNIPGEHEQWSQLCWLIWAPRERNGNHRACVGLHQVLCLYVMLVSLVFLRSS